MKNSWQHYLRRMASICLVSVATAWSSAVCYAVQLAYDSAVDVTYDNGWQAGDNGGFGFGAWDFTGTSLNLAYNVGPTHSVDDGLKAGTQTSSPYNDLGRAWTMYNPSGKPFGTANNPFGTDIARAGRSFSPLQIGQTLKVVLDNPTERSFYRGYNVKLNDGPGNVCYNGAACAPGTTPVNVWGVGTFEYFTYGQWGGTTNLFDTDTDTGVRIEFTLTAADAYSFTMTPLDNLAIAETHTGTLSNTSPINWIEFQFYNTDSDFSPTKVTPAMATDYYIRSIEITGAAPPGVPGDYNGNGKVDAADYVLWRNGGPLANEVDNPGAVNAADYTAWRARFGNTSGTGSATSSSAVPEPNTFVLIVAGVTGLISVGLRRKK